MKSMSGKSICTKTARFVFAARFLDSIENACCHYWVEIRFLPEIIFLCSASAIKYTNNPRLDALNRKTSSGKKKLEIEGIRQLREQISKAFVRLSVVRERLPCLGVSPNR